MVRGLFPAKEQETVLATLEKSVVFLTPSNVESVLLEAPYLGTAWDLANLYLGSCDISFLGDNAPSIVGLSQSTTCYVSLEYFSEEDRFADFLVHEAAHIFHNCKRKTIGLSGTARREWLLDISYRKRETFAWACECYSRIAEQAKNLSERHRLLDERKRQRPPLDKGVDGAEFFAILSDAVSARNGWKKILDHCSPESASVQTARIGIPPHIAPSSQHEKSRSFDLR
jgi:hypothetical protein